MKYDFTKFSAPLPREELEEYNRIYRDVYTQLTQSPRTVIPFLQGRTSIFTATNAILRGVKDISLKDRKELEGALTTIIGNARDVYQKELFHVRSARNWNIYLAGRFSDKYINELSRRVNETMKEVSMLATNAILKTTQAEIHPRLGDGMGSWRENYYQPAMRVGAVTGFQAYLEFVIDCLEVDGDDVYDFLFDVLDDDDNTMSMDMYDDVLKALRIDDTIESNQFYVIFEKRITEVKEYYKALAVREDMDLNVDNPKWFDYQSQIKEAMEEIAHDLTTAGLKNRRYVEVEPSNNLV